MAKEFCKVKLFGGLREKAGAAEVELPVGSVNQILIELVRDNDRLRAAIYDGDQLQTHVRVMINGRDIELSEGLETAVTANDQLAIFPPLAGG